jgi:DNA-binding NarL/FixJ family response regulator
MTQEPHLPNSTPTMQMISVVVADDHAVVRDGVTLQLQRQLDITVVGKASTGAEAFALTQRFRPAVLLLDVGMPGTQPLELVQQVRALPTPPAILMLSAYDDIEQVRGLLHAGASGYALKDETEQRLVEAVRTVAAGGRWLSARIEAALVEHSLHPTAPPALPAFTARERDVLRLLAAGKTHKEIAALLEMSINTVRFHLDNITTKLGLDSRRDVIIWAARHMDGEANGQH